MTPSTHDLLQQAHLVHHAQARLEQEHALAKLALQKIEAEVLQQICPFYSIIPSQRVIPLDKDRALVGPHLSLHFSDDPEQLPSWKAQGQEVAFRRGGPQKTRPGEITQAEFEAMPADIQLLTYKDMEQVAPIIGRGKPLQLSKRQMCMLLARMDQIGQHSFTLDTMSIWRSMIRGGVLTLVSGQSIHEWQVHPGPRFPEAIDLILTTPRLLPEDAPGRQNLVTMKENLASRTALKP